MASEEELDGLRPCMNSFWDYQKCANANGGGSESCASLKEEYQSQCSEELKAKLNKKLESGESVTGADILQGAKYDTRFPNVNQTKNCWTNYVDYQKCLKYKGEDYEPCNYFFKTYKQLCPAFWIEKWDDQLENGIFPAKI